MNFELNFRYKFKRFHNSPHCELRKGEEELSLGEVGRKTKNSSVKDIKVYTCELPEKKKN